MIRELLMRGASNAVPGRQLASSLNTDVRTIHKLIERERQDGEPICATVAGDDKGYFLAANARELDAYCRSLDRRLKNIQKTRRAVGDTLAKMAEQEQMEGW